MSTEPPENAAETASDSAENHAYFLAVEDHFIRLRGAPLLLSPEDWQTAKRWRREGIPLELVRRSLSEYFERRRKRGAETPVLSLRYCRRSVEGAWKRVRRLAAPGERGVAPAFDLPGRLEALARALPEALPEREGWAARVTALAGELEAVEEALTRLDAELLEAAAETLGSAGEEELEKAVARALGSLTGRLPESELERARGHLRRRLLRERLGLPLLSLFAPEAEGHEPPAASG